MLLEIAAFLVALLCYLFWAGTRKPENFPPGPPRLPIVGSLPFLMRTNGPGQKATLFHGILRNIEKFGPVSGFWMGGEPACVIADYDILKEVLKRESTSGRPSLGPFREHFRPGCGTMLPRDQQMVPGVIFSYGPYWAEQRKFSLRTLRQFGFERF